MIDARTLALAGVRIAEPPPPPFPVYRDGRIVFHGPAELLRDGLSIEAARRHVWDYDRAAIRRTRGGWFQLIRHA